MFKLTLFTALLTTACVATSEPDVGSAAQAIGEDACPAGVPGTLAPNADQDLAFGLDAVGVQKYVCNSAGAWAFVAPEADLSHNGQTFIHHYAGPTWEWLDGSTVVGARVAGASVDSTAIPWLLLRGASHGAIEGKLSEITAIQRLSTTGGNAPAGACTPGATIDVPYTALYLFYRTKTDHPENNTRCGA